jgi:dipeptidyl aminopeptidase/acylaminoacyl peptidase
MSSPSDLVAFYDHIAKAQGGPEARARTFVERFLGSSPAQNKEQAIAASPVTYISKDDPPFLVIHGENDLSIPVSQSEGFVKKLKEAGVDATLIVAEGRGHGVGAPQYAPEIISFFNKNLKPAAPK